MKYHGRPLLRVSRITIIMLAAIVGASACTDRPVRTVETTSTTVPPAPPTVLDPEPTTTSTTTTVPREDIPRLMVHEEGRYLALEDGTPFFPLGDTAWNIFQQLTRPEMEMYLDSLVEHGYNMVAVSFLGEAVVGYQPNPHNEDAFVGTFFESDLNEDYWDDVDFFMEEAEARGLYVYAVMAWFKEYLGSSGTSNLNPSTAERYGEQIGARYESRSNHVVFVAGGDQNLTEERNGQHPVPVANALMKGIAIGINGTEDYTGWVGTYHPARSGGTAGDWFQDEPWLHIGGTHSGSCTIFNGWEQVTADWGLTPTKPTLEMETNYEMDRNCSAGQPPDLIEPEWTVKNAYQAVLAGSLGFIYGHTNLWPLCSGPGDPLDRCLAAWNDSSSLYATARVQMQHLERLRLSRGTEDGDNWEPYLESEPNQSVITEGEGDGRRMKRALLSGGRWVMVHFPHDSDLANATIDLSVLDGPEVEAWWYSPKDGKSYNSDYEEITEPFESVPASGTREYTPPSGPPDNWVLILDSSNTDFPAPGEVREATGS